MIVKANMVSYSPSVMINTTFEVGHKHFTCEVEMILIYGRNSEWILETCDYGGISSMIIDGKRLESIDIKSYLDFLKRVGLPYEDECVNEVEKIIVGFTQREIESLINKEHKIYYTDVLKIPSENS